MAKGAGQRGSGRCGSLRRRQQHESDPFVRRARAEGWRSRAALKLEAIDARDRLFMPGAVVVDLGAAPGGWSQLAVRRVTPGGVVIAIDRLAMEPLPGVEMICDDFAEPSGLQAVEAALEGRSVDVVLSDMAPNLTGHTAVDQPAVMALAELAADFAHAWLSHRGTFLVKAFQGEDFDAFRGQLQQTFRRVLIRKPDASRAASREVYLLAREPVL
ncbi:23S rRNA methyltransferase [Halorhodospira abdelmalekii]|uniref:RlmE family RNA methyltransferase n=1 Tax=Halorhodospira abdelmalekii TaxID=421629 RepID=UPI0019044C86|nr:RlmE family RNA methyltransferase [Halorhodospira abdelmalekii]MBK1734260.1 23S rRNA methyltransferase [Halorhodospira abdelmalekii]